MLLLTLVLLHFLKIKLKQHKSGTETLYAVPAYVVKKRRPTPYRIPLPKDIPIYYL